jgi:uncharacterized protein YdbL (DUF1318 family)
MKLQLTFSRTLLAAAVIGAPMFAAAPIARAQSTDTTTATKLVAPDEKNQKEKDRLQARSEQRYPQIRQYKSQGKIGETSSGYLEAVKKDYLSDSALKELIDEENKDRKALYAILADEDGTDVSLVAKRAAKRNIERAKSGEFVKQDGTWRKK